MRIVFIGSGSVACPALRRLLQGEKYEVVRVITQPDRPSGRRRVLKPCPVKKMVYEQGVPYLEPVKIASPAVLARVVEDKPDIIVVADYGQFLPSALINIPRYNTINIHPSLLPRYRGAAPVQWTLINGDQETGVTILYVTPKMDAGDIILQRYTSVQPDERAADLTERLAEMGADALLEALSLIESGKVDPMAQDESQVVLAPRLRKQDGRLDFNRSAEELVNRVRGMFPWPGSFFEFPPGSGLPLKVIRAAVDEQTGVPGTVMAIDSDGPIIAAAPKGVKLLEVQPAGKKSMDGGSFCRGHRIEVGDNVLRGR